MTWITLLVVALGIYWWWLAYRAEEVVKDVKAEVLQNRAIVEEIRAELHKKTDDRWRRQDMLKLIQEYERLNPEVKVPKLD